MGVGVFSLARGRARWAAWAVFVYGLVEALVVVSGRKSCPTLLVPTMGARVGAVFPLWGVVVESRDLSVHHSGAKAQISDCRIGWQRHRLWTS